MKQQRSKCLRKDGWGSKRTEPLGTRTGQTDGQGTRWNLRCPVMHRAFCRHRIRFTWEMVRLQWTLATCKTKVPRVGRPQTTQDPSTHSPPLWVLLLCLSPFTASIFPKAFKLRSCGFSWRDGKRHALTPDRTSRRNDCSQVRLGKAVRALGLLIGMWVRSNVQEQTGLGVCSEGHGH